MIRYLRALPVWVELAFVLTVAFGWPVAISFVRFLWPPVAPQITEAGLAWLMLHESVLLLVLGTLLRMRGWTYERLGLAHPQPVELLFGIGIALLAYMTVIFLWLMLYVAAPATITAVAEAQRKVVGGTFGTPMILLGSVVNAAFEEILVCAYVIGALKRRFGESAAVNASAILRLSYHLYQGLGGIIMIIPIGLGFGYWYARRGRLWPLIAAHALIDIASLLRVAAG